MFFRVSRKISHFRRQKRENDKKYCPLNVPHKQKPGTKYTMKVFLYYEDNDDKSLHKTLKITLPKSWKSGPTSKLLEQFVESYNSSEQGSKHALVVEDLHLATQSNDEDKKNNVIQYNLLPSDAIITEVIDDRDAVYIRHGASKTLADIRIEKQREQERKKEELEKTVACVHFGCNNRFDPTLATRPKCCYHKSPPVFHETAKFWSCCPQKKAYDWEEFQSIPGCENGFCTDVKEENASSKSFLGGMDLRESTEVTKLKSIDDFNAAQAAGGSQAAPVLDRLKKVFEEIGIEKELFEQVLDGIRKDIGDAGDEATILNLTTESLGAKLKASMKAIVVDQLRIK